MKMTIDEHIEVLKSYSHGFTGYAGNLQDSINVAIDTMRKYQQLQADYENRLKADMVAMLTDMLIDVEEIASREQWCDYANDNCISRYDVEDLFQQKINSLKEVKDGENNN